MPGGSYSALSGMRMRMEELDRIAADLSNVSTAGYKTERTSTEAAERAFRTALDSAIDVTAGGSKIDFRAGTIATTGRDLDVAIEGRGFFEIETPAGSRYTRGGSFTRQADGLLTTMDGMPVMGEDGQLRLPAGPVTVSENGTVRVANTVVGRIRLVAFERDTDLVRESGARFRAVAGAEPDDAAGARTIGGALEQSNVSVVDRMAVLTEISRGFEALEKGISVLMNDIDGQAITQLGRK